MVKIRLATYWNCIAVFFIKFINKHLPDFLNIAVPCFILKIIYIRESSFFRNLNNLFDIECARIKSFANHVSRNSTHIPTVAAFAITFKGNIFWLKIIAKVLIAFALNCKSIYKYFSLHIFICKYPSICCFNLFVLFATRHV